MSKNNKALQVKTCKAYVMRFKMGLNQRPPDEQSGALTN